MKEALKDITEVLNIFLLITLEEMNSIRLMNRPDTKYCFRGR